MVENDWNNRNPFLNVLLTLLVVSLGFVIIGPIIGFFLSVPFYPGSTQDLIESVNEISENPALKIPLYIMQGCATLVGLIIAPAFLLKRGNKSLRDFFGGYRLDFVPLIVTLFIVVVFMAVDSVFVEWNQNFTFPEFAKGFESWAREREDAATALTGFLTKFDSPGQLALALVVIAILPAIGEEVVFRGMIQNELYRGTGNPHAAIWISAVLFSALHFQFFGFVPRVLLGALFGYLYYWSGSLPLSIFAHFVNNGVSVLAMYFYQQGSLDYDMESTESAPASVVMFSAVVTAALLFYFYKYFENRKPLHPNS